MTTTADVRTALLRTARQAGCAEPEAYVDAVMRRMHPALLPHLPALLNHDYDGGLDLMLDGGYRVHVGVTTAERETDNGTVPVWQVWADLYDASGSAGVREYAPEVVAVGDDADAALAAISALLEIGVHIPVRAEEGKK